MFTLILHNGSRTTSISHATAPPLLKKGDIIYAREMQNLKNPQHYHYLPISPSDPLKFPSIKPGQTYHFTFESGEIDDQDD